MKKLTSLLLTMVMVFTMTVTAFADTTDTGAYSITINNSVAGHTYEAYQIFAGDLNDGVLSNVQWGSSVTLKEEYADAKAADIAKRLDTSYTGEDKLTIDGLLAMITLGDKVADSGETSNPYVISGLEAGYYLVKDADGSLTGKDDSYTEYIIKVVNDVIASPKSDTTEVVKKVKDTNDTDGTTTDWQDSADYDIGDAVPFQLTATLADNVSSYNTYQVIFHDTLSAGLTYNNDAVVYIDGKEAKGFTISYEGTTLTISCDDVKVLGATDSSVIRVEYTATLNDGAVIGSAGNPNTVYLEYSNNPNDEQGGETGETPDDTVIVFTYKVVVNKVDPDGEALKGAGFTLYKKIEDEYVAIGTELKGDAMTTFTWSGLDDGDYKLVETTTPAGYNTINPIEFTVEAAHVTVSDNPTLTSLSGGDLFTGKVTTGALEGDVINQSGATLPETGGMGTTLFYVIGAILVLGAGVVLVTKKRMA